MAIISLTTVPSRFEKLEQTLVSLLNQTASIEAIQVYVPKRYRRFPEWDGTLPPVPPGVDLVRVEEDYGPASKVLHSLQATKGENTPILFCDDDRSYHHKWAEGLLRAHAEKPECCIAVRGSHLHDMIAQPPLPLPGNRARLDKYFDLPYRLQRSVQRIRNLGSGSADEKPFRGMVSKAGYTEILLGYAGALVLPAFFDDAVFDIPDAIWMVDDIWLSGHLARAEVPIWVPKGMKISRKTESEAVDALFDTVFAGDDRAASNQKAIRYFQREYGLWHSETKRTKRPVH